MATLAYEPVIRPPADPRGEAAAGSPRMFMELATEAVMLIGKAVT